MTVDEATRARVPASRRTEAPPAMRSATEPGARALPTVSSTAPAGIVRPAPSAERGASFPSPGLQRTSPRERSTDATPAAGGGAGARRRSRRPPAGLEHAPGRSRPPRPAGGRGGELPAARAPEALPPRALEGRAAGRRGGGRRPPQEQESRRREHDRRGRRDPPPGDARAN